MDTIKVIDGREVSARGLSILTQMPGKGWQRLAATVQEDEDGQYVTFAQDGVVGAEDPSNLAVNHQSDDGMFTTLIVVTEILEWFEYAYQFDGEKFVELMLEPSRVGKGDHYEQTN